MKVGNLALGAIFGRFAPKTFSAEKKRRFQAIAQITESTVDEVREFYASHDYSLDYIEATARLCGKLDEDEMELAAAEDFVSLLFPDSRKLMADD